MTWYGTYATTPNISAAASDLKMEAEVENLEPEARTVSVRHTLLDAENREVCRFESEEQTLAPKEVFNFSNTYENIPSPHLWSPDDPYLYTVCTDVFSNHELVDTVETTMGFRWMEWDAQEGFFLNGEHLWLNGANAHQDHAGWANAVSDSALYRDVEMIKEAGMNFIRGSHYPHAPVYSQACDELWASSSGQKRPSGSPEAHQEKAEQAILPTICIRAIPRKWNTRKPLSSPAWMLWKIWSASTAIILPSPSGAWAMNASSQIRRMIPELICMKKRKA